MTRYSITQVGCLPRAAIDRRMLDIGAQFFSTTIRCPRRPYRTDPDARLLALVLLVQALNIGLKRMRRRKNLVLVVTRSCPVNALVALARLPDHLRHTVIGATKLVRVPLTAAPTVSSCRSLHTAMQDGCGAPILRASGRVGRAGTDPALS